MVMHSITLRTSECLICLRFPCQRHCSSRRKCEKLQGKCLNYRFFPKHLCTLRFFYNSEGKAVYHFNNEHFSIAIPLPLGGKSTEELHFPPALTTPSVSLPQFGLEIVSMEIPIPELVVPESLTLSIPLFGKAEISTLMKSNLYEMEASMAAGKDIVDTPSYSAKFDVRGTSPVDILSFTMTGN